MAGVLVGGHAKIEHEIGGVTRRGKGSLPFHGEIHRRIVDPFSDLVNGLDRQEMNHWSFCEKHLCIRLFQLEQILVPLETLHVHATAEDSIFGGSDLVARLVTQNLELHIHRINRDGVLARIILPSTSQETVHKEESVDVEEVRNGVIKPVFEKFESDNDFLHIATQGFHRHKRVFEPLVRNRVDLQQLKSLFKVT